MKTTFFVLLFCLANQKDSVFIPNTKIELDTINDTCFYYKLTVDTCGYWFVLESDTVRL